MASHHLNRPRHIRPMLQLLEARRLLTVSLKIDYSLDASGFFGVQSRKDALEFAAAKIGAKLNDRLSAVAPSGSNTFALKLTNPATGLETTINNPTIPADTILIYVGARDVNGAELGIGGPAGYSASGSNSFLNLLNSRGQAGAGGSASQQTDTAPLAGAVTFDSTATWSFDIAAAPSSSNSNDFLSVAEHELTHVLGIGLAASWSNLITNQTFTGPAARSVYSGAVPVTANGGHFAAGVISPGQTEAAMAPSITTGTRKLLTNLDLAALNDIGWQVSGFSSPNSDTTPPVVSLATDLSTTATGLTADIKVTDDIGLTGDIPASAVSFTRDSDGLSFSVASFSQTAFTATSRQYRLVINIPGGQITTATAGRYSLHVSAAAVSDTSANGSAKADFGPYVLSAPTRPIDLAAVAIPGTATAFSTTIGAPSTVSFRVSNAGTTAFSKTADIRLVLSRDAASSSDDTVLARTSAAALNLAVGAFSVRTLKVTTPAVAADGTYHLLATVIAPGDGDATNDTVDLGTFNLQKARPDLALTVVKPPAKLPASRRVTLNLRLTNAGNLDVNQSPVISVLAGKSASDPSPVTLTKITVPKQTIARGKFITVPVTVTVPKGRVLILKLASGGTDVVSANNRVTLTFA